MGMSKTEGATLTHTEKVAYISGVLDGATVAPECRQVCKELLAELAIEIASKHKPKDPLRWGE
jgi:hypothetical protein